MKITLIYDSKEHILDFSEEDKKNMSLAQFIFLSNLVPARPLCAGIASCGRCKVIYHSKAPQLTFTEEKVLRKDEKEKNIRLSCRHSLDNGIVIEVLKESTSHESIIKNGKKEKNKNVSINDTHIDVKSRLFIDIGTTSIAWQCHPLYEHQKIQELTLSGSNLNPQMIAGADIMARLHTAKTILQNTNKANLLSKLIEKHIKDIIKYIHVYFTKNTQYRVFIEDIFIAANPSIMALSLNTDIQGLCSAPYILTDFGNRYTELASLPKIWIAPQMSPFIGADACAGLAYILSTTQPHENTNDTDFSPKQESFLLADMGTNGEFILYNPLLHNTLLGASVPLGPAIEGVGMRFGAPVHTDTENVILSFKLGMQGLEFICKGIPKHICGAAYLNLVHILLSQKLLDRQGFFINIEQDAENDTSTNFSSSNNEILSPLAKKIAKSIRKENEELRLYITENLYICSEDIENIMKVKSAFATALFLLTKNKPIKTLYLSGALADYIPLNHLENLGFIPNGMAKNTKTLGNTSLKGLISLSKSEYLTKFIASEARKAQILDLTANPLFSKLFIENMHF